MPISAESNKRRTEMPARKERSLPRPGRTFTRNFKGVNYALRVVRTANGVGYVLEGVTYPSPSAAAKTITGGEVNGWRFWGIDPDKAGEGA